MTERRHLITKITYLLLLLLLAAPALAQEESSQVDPPMLIVGAAGLYLRTEPDSSPDVIAFLVSGVELPITGISEDGAYYQVTYGADIYWVWVEMLNRISGDVDDLEIIPVPMSTPTPHPTRTPASVNSLTPTPEMSNVEINSPFLFIIRNNQVFFTENFANPVGCDWQGLGGAVFDMDGDPLNGIIVHVFGADTDIYSVSGTNTFYGKSGWEIQVDDGLNKETYLVELQSEAGVIISPTALVTFNGTCDANLAIINFDQIRAYTQELPVSSTAP